MVSNAPYREERNGLRSMMISIWIESKAADAVDVIAITLFLLAVNQTVRWPPSKNVKPQLKLSRYTNW